MYFLQNGFESIKNRFESLKVFLKQIVCRRNGFESIKRDSNLMMNIKIFQKIGSNLLKRDSNRLMNIMFFQKMDSTPLKGDSNLKGYFSIKTFSIYQGFESKSNRFESSTVKLD